MSWAEWRAALGEQYSIRPMHRADIPATREMVAAAFSSFELGDEVEHQLEVYCGCLLDSLPLEEQRDGLPREYYSIVQVAGTKEHIVGLAGLYRFGLWTWEKIWWIGWFCISPDHQAAGLGGEALEFLMRLARSRGAELLKVETPAGGRAVQFYEKNGFHREAVLKQHYSADLDAEVLTRSLDGVNSVDPRIAI